MNQEQKSRTWHESIYEEDAECPGKARSHRYNEIGAFHDAKLTISLF